METVLLATKPGGEDNTTILAGWNYGLGRAVAFTTDAGLQWTPGLGRQPGGRQALRPDHPLVDAALGRIGQADRDLRAAGRQDAGRRHGAGRQERVSQLPHHDRHGRRTRFEEAAGPGDRADRAGPLRGHVPRSRGGKLLRDDQSGPRHGALADGRERALFRRVPRPRGQRRPLDPACRRAAQGRSAGPTDREPGRARRAPASCWSSTPSATTCPRPPAARRHGTGWSSWPVASSWATCSSAA